MFYPPAQVMLQAVKSTHSILSPHRIQKEYQFVTSGERKAHMMSVSLLAELFNSKKAINLVLDSIIAIIASVLETNYCL